MAAIPNRVTERLIAGLKRYQPILVAAKARDGGEAGAVTIIKNMLADVLGYDKHSASLIPESAFAKIGQMPNSLKGKGRRNRTRLLEIGNV